MDLGVVLRGVAKCIVVVLGTETYPAFLNFCYRPINIRLYLLHLTFTKQPLRLIKIPHSPLKLAFPNVINPLGQIQIIQRVLVHGCYLLILFVVFDCLLMLVLHEVTESAVKVELWVKVG